MVNTQDSGHRWTRDGPRWSRAGADQCHCSTARIRKVLRATWCQNKTCVSFPRRCPNSCLRHLGTRDFKWRRTGCLAKGARMKRKPLCQASGEGRACCRHCCAGGWTRSKARGGQGFLFFFGNVSLLIQLWKSLSLFPCICRNFKMRSCFSSPWGMPETEPQEIQVC